MIKGQPTNLDSALVDYADVLVKDRRNVNSDLPAVVSSEFIKWKDRPELWSSAWADTHVLAIVNDHSMHELRSVSEIECSFKTQAEYNIHNVPYSFRKTLSSNSGLITHQEYLALQRDMGGMDRAEWRKEQDKFLSSLMDDLDTYQSIEYPIVIQLTGDDDTSYALAVDTVGAALEIIKGLKNLSTWDNLKEYGFRMM